MSKYDNFMESNALKSLMAGDKEEAERSLRTLNITEFWYLIDTMSKLSELARDTMMSKKELI